MAPLAGMPALLAKPALLAHLCNQNWGGGCRGCWVEGFLTAPGVLRRIGESAEEQAGDTWEDRFALSRVPTSGLCMLCCLCALVLLPLPM